MSPEEQQQRASVLAYLNSGPWQEGAVFRESPWYLSRRLYPTRAHHPLLLNCFPANRDGAKYHRVMACLFDRMIDRLQVAGQNDLAHNLVTTHSTFVELVRFPTRDNNGNEVLSLFRGEVPQGWGNGAGFTDFQGRHRENHLAEWLLNNSQRTRPGQSPCTVVLPKSVFKVLCQAEWRGLNMRIFNHRMNQFGNGDVVAIDAPHLNDTQPLPADFHQCRWHVTRGFPYFRGRGLNDEAIGAALTQLGEVLADALQQPGANNAGQP